MPSPVPPTSRWAFRLRGIGFLSPVPGAVGGDHTGPTSPAPKHDLRIGDPAIFGPPGRIRSAVFLDIGVMNRHDAPPSFICLASCSYRSYHQSFSISHVRATNGWRERPGDLRPDGPGNVRH